jgi:hypothetical protein
MAVNMLSELDIRVLSFELEMVVQVSWRHVLRYCSFIYFQTQLMKTEPGNLNTVSK